MKKTEKGSTINIVKVKMVKESSMAYNTPVANPEDAANLVREYLDGADRENFVAICLDRKGKPNAIHTVSIGSLHSSVVHPREVFKAAILSNSASIIVAHNHPSGDVTPSHDDITVTNRLKEAGKILGIEVLDHVVVGDDSFYSMQGNGLM